MTERDWYDDSDYERAVEQAERTVRAAWGVIAGVGGLIVAAVIAVLLFCLLLAFGIAYVAVAAAHP